jgi:hypothetical protein
MNISLCLVFLKTFRTHRCLHLQKETYQLCNSFWVSFSNSASIKVNCNKVAAAKLTRELLAFHSNRLKSRLRNSLATMVTSMCLLQCPCLARGPTMVLPIRVCTSTSNRGAIRMRILTSGLKQINLQVDTMQQPGMAGLNIVHTILIGELIGNQEMAMVEQDLGHNQMV